MNIQHNIQLQPYNSFRTKAIAKLFAQPKTVEELQEILAIYPSENKLIIGNGCNMFFTQDFDGLIIHPQMSGIHILQETNDTVLLEAGAAEDWDNFVAHCVSNGWAGVENLSLIPGTVGASPVQNIGAYGAEVKDVIVAVKTVRLNDGSIASFPNADCDFSYRNSIFKKTRKEVITSVVFQLKKTFAYTEKYADLNRELANNPNPTLQQVRDAVIKVRTQKLPNHLQLPNAGSFFKNPVLTKEEKDKLLLALPDAPMYIVGDNAFKTSAAYLIDQAGCKGKRVGDVGIYERHALIIVNYGTDSGTDILHFMQEVQNTVSRLYGVKLELEVWIF